MERKQCHSSCPGDIGAADRRGTISNCPRRGACQSAPASIESAPSLLRHDCSRSIDSPFTTDDESVSDLKAPRLSPSQQQATDAEESSQAKPKTISLEESWENSSGSESKSPSPSCSNEGAARLEEHLQEETAALPLSLRGVHGSGRESKSSAPCSRVRKRAGASVTSRSKPSTIALEPARHAVVTASGRHATTQKDGPQMGLKKGIHASPSQARKRARNREDLNTPSTSLGLIGTQERKRSTRATRETGGGASIAAQREYPREEHSAPVPRRDSRGRERVESRGDINVGASTSQGTAGIQARKRSATALCEATSGTSKAAHLAGPRYYAPGHRQQSQLQEYVQVEDSATSTSKGNLGIQREHSPVASTSRGDLLPRDSPGQFRMKTHRKAQGACDNQPGPERISSGDEPSGVASSGATEAASAFPSMQRRNPLVVASSQSCKKRKRRRKKSATGKIEEVEVKRSQKR